MKPESIEIKNRASNYKQKTRFSGQRRDFYWKIDADSTRNQSKRTARAGDLERGYFTGLGILSKIRFWKLGVPYNERETPKEQFLEQKFLQIKDPPERTRVRKQGISGNLKDLIFGVGDQHKNQNQQEVLRSCFLFYLQKFR